MATLSTTHHDIKHGAHYVCNRTFVRLDTSYVRVDTEKRQEKTRQTRGNNGKSVMLRSCDHCWTIFIVNIIEYFGLITSRFSCGRDRTNIFMISEFLDPLYCYRTIIIKPKKRLSLIRKRQASWHQARYAPWATVHDAMNH